MAPPVNNKRKRSADHPGKGAPGKRWKPSNGEDGEALDPAQREASLKAYMFHANKLLHKACKKSKTFEVQKLTRKIKSTREPKEGKVDETQAKDLEAQLSVLKALSIDPIPPHLLTSRIPKLPCLRTVEFVSAVLKAVPVSNWTELDGQSVEGKARNRVLANKAVHEAWEEVVRAVRRRMGEEVEPAPAKNAKSPGGKESVGGDKGKGKALESLAPTENGEKRLSKRAERALKAAETKKNLPKRSMEMNAERKAALEAADPENSDGEESSEDEGPIPGSEDEELDDDEIARELAAMDEGVGSEGEWSDSDDEGAGPALDDDDDDDASDSSLPPRPSKRSKAALSPSPPPAGKRTKSVREPPAHKPVTSSAFLPSLAAGYVSYSDSDGEDAKWVKDAEREEKKGPRKNRRGQRARQAIWEKKYGSAAAHVVKASGGKPVPLEKLKKNKAARKNGTADPAPRKPEENKPFNPLNAPGGSTNPNAQPVGPRKTAPAATAASGATSYGAPASAAPPGEKMHPSWEAKRKAAEALKNSASIQPQGKKITFD
ncbi:hypothetical protein JCM10212_002810 [Sporobolomyces blumeae]